ncbi:DUF4007 family protein [Maribellus sediminis]|uniref:DUF4007 family protein n=1 Tax=Maribellus sediminis TaxID=2696285 RepID=UPI001431AC00|nr:DUF4007 family protein [Maribellus sediminis]
MSLKFSGHETFVVRSFWPKKGYDFISNEGSFNSQDAVVSLGVGKNMVASINFWMKALGLVDAKDNTRTEIADFLFGKDGVDPYLEDITSIWLLHYMLVKNDFASIYHAVFNHFRKERSSFKKSQLKAFIKRLYLEADDNRFNEATVEKDISVLCRLYNTPDYRNIKKDYEDEVSSLMLELSLMHSSFETIEVEKGKKREEWFHLKSENRKNLPYIVTLFVILDQNEGSTSISFRRMEVEENSPGLLFLLNKDGLYEQLKMIEANIEGIKVDESQGNINLFLPEDLDKWQLLRQYYAN